MRTLFATILALSAFVCAAADEKKKDDPEPAAPKPPPAADVRGKVVKREPVAARTVLGNILVEGKKEKDTQFDAASVQVRVTSKVFVWKDGKKEKAGFEDVKVDSLVQCTFTGAVDTSLPVGAIAAEVLILPAAKPRPGK